MELAFGYSAGIPENIHTAWGARLIAPDDLVHNRQDLVAESDWDKQDLIDWLNPGPDWSGAITHMRKWLHEHQYSIHGDRVEEFTIYEDDRGKIVGNTNASYGYVYVAGWLKERK